MKMIGGHWIKWIDFCLHIVRRQKFQIYTQTIVGATIRVLVGNVATIRKKETAGTVNSKYAIIDIFERKIKANI